MSKSQAIAFFEEISKNNQLAQEVKKVVGGKNSDEAKAKELLSLAKDHGFNFTQEEVESVQKTQYTKFSIDDLVEVSGGKGGFKSSFMALALLAGIGVGGATLANNEASADGPEFTVIGSDAACAKQNSNTDTMESKVASQTTEADQKTDNTSSSQSSICSEKIKTLEDMINILHNGDPEEQPKLEEKLNAVEQKGLGDAAYFEALDMIARKFFNNNEITLPRNPKTAKEWIRHGAKVFAAFPMLKGLVGVAKSQNDNDGFASAEMVGVFVEYFDAAEVALNIDGKDDLTATNTKYKQVKGYDRRYTLVHELGHAVDCLLQNMNGRRIFEEIFDCVNPNEQYNPSAKEKYEKMDEKAQSLNNSRLEKLKTEIGTLSPYAANQANYNTMLAEGFAEAITDVVINGNEAQDLSKLVLKSLMEKNFDDGYLTDMGLA